MLMLIRRSVTLARVLSNLRFELGVESSAAETELVLVVLRTLNSLEAATDSGGTILIMSV